MSNCKTCKKPIELYGLDSDSPKICQCVVCQFCARAFRETDEAITVAATDDLAAAFDPTDQGACERCWEALTVLSELSEQEKATMSLLCAVFSDAKMVREGAAQLMQTRLASTGTRTTVLGQRVGAFAVLFNRACSKDARKKARKQLESEK